MITEIKDFIGMYSGVYPDGYCAHMVEEFDRLQEIGCGTNRQERDGVPKHAKNDFSIGFNFKGQCPNPFKEEFSINLFFNGLQKCFEHYSTEFSSLKECKLFATEAKAQKTSAGGGYHIWHHEQGNDWAAHRGLVYMLYLNTLAPESAGETEFLYQQRRIRPIENTMLIWPAGYTHVHRGNAVYGQQSKYVITGWFYYS